MPVLEIINSNSSMKVAKLCCCQRENNHKVFLLCHWRFNWAVVCIYDDA